MENTKKQQGVTRRGFIRTVGIGGVAATALGIPGAVGAQVPAGGQAAAMPKRKLGKTGAEVSILCLGGMFDTVNNQLLLRQALNWGVTYWDTAEAYGNGLSEDGFGRFFTRYPETRKDIFLVTKFRPSPPDKLSEALDKGLKRLHTDYVDVFFTHGISDFNQITGVRDWAEQMKKAGKIKFFGFSTHTNMEDCLLAAAKSGWIDSVMFTYNFRLMNSPKMKEAVDACAQAGIGLGHCFGVDEFEGNRATLIVRRCPDLTITAGAGGKHGVQLVLPAVNNDPFAVFHGIFSGFHDSVRVQYSVNLPAMT